MESLVIAPFQKLSKNTMMKKQRFNLYINIYPQRKQWLMYFQRNIPLYHYKNQVIITKKVTLESRDGTTLRRRRAFLPPTSPSPSNVAQVQFRPGANAIIMWV